MARVDAAISYTEDTAPPSNQRPDTAPAATASPARPGIWHRAAPGAAPAGDTTALDTPLSRSRSTPTSSGSPHTASGRTTPATVWHWASGPRRNGSNPLAIL